MLKLLSQSPPSGWVRRLSGKPIRGWRSVTPDYFSNLPNYPSTGEAKVPLPGEREAIMSAVEIAFLDMEKSTVDGIRVKYSDGWYLCRPSNTEPILVMRAEGRNQAALDTIIADVNRRIGGMIDLENLV